MRLARAKQLLNKDDSKSDSITGCRPTPSPIPLRVAKAGRNILNEEITPLLPTGIGERYSQTVSNLGHAALLRRCDLPPVNKSAELTQGALSS
jgi:hypothetical protein